MFNFGFQEDTLAVLGNKVSGPIDMIEALPAPKGIRQVTMTQLEFTSLCPVTGAPDYGTVEITFVPKDFIIESKSLKLWLWSYREKGVFCEALAVEIAQKLFEWIDPVAIRVIVHQNPRGGIAVDAVAEFGDLTNF